MRKSVVWAAVLLGGVGCQLVGDFEELRPGFSGAGGTGSGTGTASTGSGMGSSSGCVNSGTGGGGHTFSTSFGDESTQRASAITVVSDNAIVVGDFSGTLEGITPTAPQSLGGQDIFAMKFDANENLVWGMGFGGTSDQFARGVNALSSTNIVFVGSFKDELNFGGPNTLSTVDPLDLNAFYARLDGSGTYLGAGQFGDGASAQKAEKVANTSSAVYVAGTFGGDIAMGAPCSPLTGGSDDLYVTELTSSGTCTWARALAASKVPVLGGMAVAKLGDVILTGGFTGTLSASPEPDIISNSTDKNDLFVIRLQGSDGSCNWVKRFGDQEDQIATAVAVHNSDNIIVTGNYSGTLDFGLGANNPEASMSSSNLFVVKLNSAGTPDWAVSFPSQSVQNAKAISIDSNGNPIITGSFQGTFNLPGLPPVCSPSSGSNVFLLKLDGSDGSPIWAKSFGDDQNQEGTGIAVDSNNNIWLTGNFDGSIDFGGNILTSKGGNDIFIAKFAP